MSFEIYIQCFESGKPAGMPHAKVRALFPAEKPDQVGDDWNIRYAPDDFSWMLVRCLEGHTDLIHNVSVEPCAAPEFWDSVYRMLLLGNVVVYWPGEGPFAVAQEAAIAHLPESMVNEVGVSVVRSGVEIKQRIES